jgi:putative tricarboxylic transport membrane protein
MRTGDLLAALFWLAVAAYVTVAGWKLDLGSLNDPGSGFMIFWVGAVMTVLSLAAVLAAVRQPAGEALASLWAGTRWMLVPYVIVLLALYAWLLPTLGFIVGTIILLSLLFKTIEPSGWFASLFAAVATTGVSYVVFNRWLKTQLPAGEVAEWLSPWVSPWIF